MEEILDSFLDIAAKHETSILEILDYLIDEEKKRRETPFFEARLKWSRLPVRKELREFGFTFQPTIDPAVILDLKTPRFLHSAENVVFLGPPWAGKIHLAIGMGIASMNEAGSRPFDSKAGCCVFEVISRRYERSSTLLTSNKSYGGWGEIFKDQVIATAILDRLLHHCLTLNIGGGSYQLRERKRIGPMPPLQKG